MKRTVIINLSPRKKGTSVMLSNLCRDFLYERGHQSEIIDLYQNLKNMMVILDGIEESDTIIMVGPSYIDSFPADTVYLLDQMTENQEILHGQKLYGIIQGGMPYVHTHESGLKMLEIFSTESNIIYKGGFVIGLGPVINGTSLNKLPNAKKIKKNFNLFLNHIENGEISPAQLYYDSQLKMPGIVYCYLAKVMNKRIKKELVQKGIDYSQRSPYLSRSDK